MNSRAPHFVVIGARLCTPTPAIAAVQVSRRRSYASDQGTDGVHVWSTETLHLEPWNGLEPGTAAAQIVEAAYLRSYWHDDAPVCLEQPHLPLLGWTQAILYGAVSFGLGANNRKMLALTSREALLALHAKTMAGLIAAISGFAYSTGAGSMKVGERKQEPDSSERDEALAIGLAIAGARRLLADERRGSERGE